MTAPCVRRAGAADLAALVVLFDAYRQFYGQAPDLALARRFLGERISRNESVLFLGGLAGEPAGFCQLYPSFCSVEAAPVMVLYDLFVGTSARGRGLAGALMHAAEAHARDAGCVRLDLSTAHDNLAAQALYESRGWVGDEVFRVYSLRL